jgi:hypothetical protein
VREVVIIAVGAVWGADYELYAHRAVARTAGLSEDAVTALADGRIPDDLSEHEKIAARVAHELSTRRRVDDKLYRAAEKAFGTTGLFDIAALTGQYRSHLRWVPVKQQTTTASHPSPGPSGAVRPRKASTISAQAVPVSNRPPSVHAAEIPPTDALPTDRSSSWPPPSTPSRPALSASARPTAPPTRPNRGGAASWR